MHSDHVPRTQSTGLHRWRDIANVLQVQFDFDAPQPEDFVGSIVDHDLGPVRLYEIEATAHVARRNTTGCVHGELPRTLVTMHEAGACEVEHRGRVHALAPGDMTILHSAQPFTLRFPGPMREHVMSIPAQLLGHEMIASRHLAAISIPCREGIGRIARELLASTLTSVAELSTSERERVAHSLIDVFNTLAGSVLATAGKDLMDNGAYQVERITQYMYENLRDPTLSARNIAEALGISRRYMNKLFQREGTTVGRALLARRLEGSYRDLSDPYKRARSVTEIAYAWGFNSPSHFSRAFRQRFGMSPREARGGG
mgnify:FL=1